MNNYCFIGGGNMAKALIGGLLSNGAPKTSINVVDPNTDARKQCESLYQIHTFEIPDHAISKANIVVLAVKPNVVRNALAKIRRVYQSQSLLISVAAGIQISTLESLIGNARAIVRAMPNTPALVGRGATAVKANLNVNMAEKELVEKIFGAIGIVRWVDEEKNLDAVTAISGSGPAYFFLFVELLEKAALEIGLGKELARDLAFETFCGSAALLEQSGDPANVLRAKVTSPGGTTEKALSYFKEKNLYSQYLEAIKQAQKQAELLSKQ